MLLPRWWGGTSGSIVKPVQLVASQPASHAGSPALLVKGGVFFVAPHETSCELHPLEKLVGRRQTKRRLVPGPVHSLVKVVGVRCRHVSAATFYRCVAAGGMKNLLSFTFRSTALKKGGVGWPTIRNELLMGFKGYKFVGGELNT